MTARKQIDDEVDDDPKGATETERFEIPIRGKTPAKIIVPKGLSPEDWVMLKVMLDAYINRSHGK